MHTLSEILSTLTSDSHIHSKDPGSSFGVNVFRLACPGGGIASSANASSVYDERYVNTWSPRRPWTRCVGASGRRRTSVIAWTARTENLEQLDQAVYEHAARRFQRDVERAGL